MGHMTHKDNVKSGRQRTAKSKKIAQIPIARMKITDEACAHESHHHKNVVGKNHPAFKKKAFDQRHKNDVKRGDKTTLCGACVLKPPRLKDHKKREHHAWPERHLERSPVLHTP